ncbi:hypothetical protein K435DRAFT_799415 [Dendrothele bispora CBS 962.96]|uniref:Uncharacterized protein n=1 Tax=Dendrothele bispora (strain CBS 962.96) TaxID=1314807 RepID=A0A4S8LWM3_DENBC|nr:hypothetical protein K435DRAFT_799415 [Dendrothele bispora CBS 962.96]
MSYEILDTYLANNRKIDIQTYFSDSSLKAEDNEIFTDSRASRACHLTGTLELVKTSAHKFGLVTEEIANGPDKCLPRWLPGCIRGANHERQDLFRIRGLGVGTGLVTGEVAETSLNRLHCCLKFYIISYLISFDSYWPTFSSFGQTVEETTSPAPLSTAYPDLGTFDLVFGADTIHEPLHADPTKYDEDRPKFHLSHAKRSDLDLVILSKDAMLCNANSGKEDEEEVVYYVVGWGSVEREGKCSTWSSGVFREKHYHNQRREKAKDRHSYRPHHVTSWAARLRNFEDTNLILDSPHKCVVEYTIRFTR